MREHEKLRERIVAKMEYCGKEQRTVGKNKERWEKELWGRAEYLRRNNFRKDRAWRKTAL